MHPFAFAFARLLQSRTRCFLLAAALGLPLAAISEEPTVKTYSFKTLNPPGNQLQADVHRPPGDAVRPVIVFIHGGALMMGDRKLTPNPGSLLEAYDPAEEPSAFDPFGPVRKVTSDYPPTLLVHGTKDTDVPYELSVEMAKQLAAKGVAHELITIPDGGHGFDKRNAGIAVRTYRQVVEFLDEHRRR